MHQQPRTEVEPGKRNCTRKEPCTVLPASRPPTEATRGGQPRDTGASALLLLSETSQILSQKITVLCLNCLLLPKLNHKPRTF